MTRRQKSMTYALLILPLGYLGICVVLYTQQDRMIFLPSRENPDVLTSAAAAQGFEPWLDDRGEPIGWKSREGDPSQALLVCNGNAGYALFRTHYRQSLAAQGSNWKTYLLEYPGYGARPGSPTEPAVTAAALEAFDRLATDPNRTIRVLGESLGSGVASAVAGARPQRVAGLILVTPYDSLRHAAQCHYPWLPVSLLLRTRFDSVENLQSFPGPVAFLVGENDTTVPTKLGIKLHATYPGRKKLWLVPEAGHDVSGFIETQWPEVATFLQATP